MNASRIKFAALATSLVVAAGLARGLAGSDEKPMLTVRAEEIGRSVTVLGRLGPSLGSVVTITGVWRETIGRAKPGTSLWFCVDDVNGTRLDVPVEFRDLDVEAVAQSGKVVQPVKGERWSLRAYETWPAYGHPAEFLQELGHQPISPPKRSATRLIGIVKDRKR
jgi:hypothetical protein